MQQEQGHGALHVLRAAGHKVLLERGAAQPPGPARAHHGPAGHARADEVRVLGLREDQRHRLHAAVQEGLPALRATGGCKFCRLNLCSFIMFWCFYFFAVFVGLCLTYRYV